MNILALDTSSDVLSLACGQEHQGQMTICGIDNSNTGLQHGVSLVPAINALLDQVGWAKAAIDQIVVGIGPGSYTGLRIGVTLAKMWGISTGKEVRRVSSLALIANQVTTDEVYILPIVDARRVSCYTNIYFRTGGKLKALGPDIHIDWVSWQDRLSSFFEDKPDANVVLIGKGIQDFVSIFQTNHPGLSLQVLDQEDIFPDASQAFKGLETVGVEELHFLAPAYAHATLAEQEWAAKDQRENMEEDDHEGYIEHFS